MKKQKTDRTYTLGIAKQVHHEVNGKTGEHRQWLVKNPGTNKEKRVEIFKGDPDWEE